MRDLTPFRAEVRKALTLRGWHNPDLARATGYSTAYVSQIIGKGRCSVKACRAIAAALGIPQRYIL